MIKFKKYSLIVNLENYLLIQKIMIFQNNYRMIIIKMITSINNKKMGKLKNSNLKK